MEAVDLVELAHFEEMLRNRIAFARSPQEPITGPTVEDLMRLDPDKPRAVAEYEVRQIAKHRAESDRLIAFEFAHVTSIDSLAKLSTREAAARRLEAGSPRYHYRRGLEVARKQGCPADTAAERVVLATLAKESKRIIGSVLDGDTAHVVVAKSRNADGTPYHYSPAPTVMRVVRSGNRWLIRDWEEQPEHSLFSVGCER